MSAGLSGMLRVWGYASGRRGDAARAFGFARRRAGGRRAGSGAQAQTAARFASGRRAAGAASRAKQDSAGAERDGRVFAGGDERGDSDSDGMDRAAAGARGGVGGWFAGRSRCAAETGDVREDSGKHGRARSEHSLDDHAADAGAGRIPRGICGVLERAARSGSRVGERIYAADRRAERGDADAERSREIGARVAGAGETLQETFVHGRSGEGVFESAEKSGRLRVREDVGELFGGFAKPRGTVRLRRHAGLLAMRVRDQQRIALGAYGESGGAGEGGSLHAGVDERGSIRESVSRSGG